MYAGNLSQSEGTPNVKAFLQREPQRGSDQSFLVSNTTYAE